MSTSAHSFLRSRAGAARVSNEELFFDLAYVFAVTQLSHYLLQHLTPLGALQTLVMWFAVWLGWQYTAWTTNWFDPNACRYAARCSRSCCWRWRWRWRW